MGRMDKINQLIKREISSLIQEEIQDPGLGFVTIIGVDVSRDLKYAKVNYSVLGAEPEIQKAKEALHRARSYIRKLVGQRIRIRYTPEIDFIYDDSLAYEARLDKTFEDIRNNYSTNDN